MSDSLFEQRLSAVERAVEELKESLRKRGVAANWLERVIGSMKDEPAFCEVVEYGRAFRQANHPSNLSHGQA